ncbi:tRNA (adenosine(37)-N6)-threonylcarbamoyltransferase complex ATPase subunit type 1 TsaE [Alicyclobacillus suci]|uniref:tRNA (adenosine(37)-N6)-threonylcarbamoyltransferase complex ATPase subunit type 1 TsaE n=1 Tax=Alicyclobacillus suci TaxID=2816080 RepID=UPI001A8D64A7|nr:tRNA (adenosine(37)-N6)-threonylcarbamoyltransferase complex ATPase subunit type 1 TsaE [Alicyclobacillus suci]
MANEWLMTTTSPDETRRFGVCLGGVLQAGDVVLLGGPLGAGKTHFAQGIAQGLGVEEPVTSPTFTLVAEYEGRLPLIHMDLYRLYDEPTAEVVTLHPAALAQIGFDDYLDGSGVVLIEWARGVESDLDDYLSVDIAHGLQAVDDDTRATTRELRVRAEGASARQRLQEWMDAWA